MDRSWAEPAGRSNRRILIGTYTRGTDSKGIYCTELDSCSGQLAAPRLVAATDNPSWLLCTGDRLIAANEFADRAGGGELSVFASSGDAIDLIQRRPSLGADPCHLGCATDRLAVANYSGGTVALYEWSGSEIGALVRLLSHDRSGPHPRQQSAHPHGAYFIGSELWIPDLGADRIYRYDPTDGSLLAEISVAPGAGPRHLTPGGEFLVNELDNTIAPLAGNGSHDFHDRAGAALTTLPRGWQGVSSTAEIQLSGERLYVSNRGHDSITVFATQPCLAPLQHQSSFGSHPRHFFIDPSGAWLLVANRDSNNIVCLPLDEAGRIGEPAAEIACPSPVHLTIWS